MSQNESLGPEEAEDSGGICGHERSQVTVQQQFGSLFSTEDFYLHDFRQSPGCCYTSLSVMGSSAAWGWLGAWDLQGQQGREGSA